MKIYKLFGLVVFPPSSVILLLVLVLFYILFVQLCVIMKEKIIPNLPEIQSGDLQEAAEMIRATMTCLRQSYSLIWMRKVQFSDLDDSKIKDFTEHFDKVQSVLYDSYNVFMNHFGEFVEREKSKSHATKC